MATPLIQPPRTATGAIDHERRFEVRLSGDPLVADIYHPHSGSQRLPILLVHGWGGTGRYWQSTIAHLRPHTTLIVPDLPGSGRSVPVAAGRTIVDQAIALEALLLRLGINQIQLVGHSMGGAIAMLLAARRPQLVERLALVGFSMFRNDAERLLFSGITEISGLLMRFRTPAMAEVPLLVRQFATRFFYQVPDDAALLRAGLLDYIQMDYATALASARSATSPEIPQAASRIQCPTLLIAARQDQIMPVSNVPYTVKQIRDCRLAWIEECGHLPMVEKPDELAQLLGEFLVG